jgi:2-dehydro-3-deoxyphosphogluconate aldolase/(4S)-4-hydroxy-2-oxoglutarate aldolase
MSFPLRATSALGQPKDFGSVLVSPLLPVVPAVPDVESGLRVAEALRDAGLLQIEITFRSTEAPQALRAVVREFPEMTVGAGTLLTPEQVREAKDGGAHFGVSPGSNPRVLKAAREAGLPFLPGVATPTEIELVLEQGYLWQKIPGILGNFDSFLGWIHGAYAHTGLRVVPAGGTTCENLAARLQHPLIGACAGTWITPDSLIREKKWGEIEALALKFRQAVAKPVLTKG